MTKREVMNVFNKISKEYKKLRKKNQQVGRIGKWKKYSLVLDEGCGPGTNLASIVENTKFYVALDISLNMVIEAKEEAKSRKWKVDLLVADAAFLPFRNEVFDFLAAVAIFHHLPKNEAERAIEEAKRTLRSSGVAFFTFWNIKFVKEGKILERNGDLFYVAWKTSNQKILKRPYFSYTLEELDKIIRERFSFYDILVSQNLVCIGMKY